MSWMTPPKRLLSDALAALTPPLRTAIVAMLRGWDGGSDVAFRQVYLNLNNETALSLVDLTQLLTDVADAICAGLNQDEAWREKCWTHQFRGARLTAPLPMLLGRAVPLEQYAETVVDTSKRLSQAQARSLIRRVLRAGAKANRRDSTVLQTVAIGQHLVWATFDPAMTGDPFATAPTTAAALRIALGLGHLPPGTALIKLRYLRAKAGDVLVLHRPTISDAADHAYYRPANAGELHGWVVPLAPNAQNYPKRREAVHKSAVGALLTLPMEEAA